MWRYAADAILSAADLRTALAPLAPVENRTRSGIDPKRHRSWDTGFRRYRDDCSQRFQDAAEYLVSTHRRSGRGGSRLPQRGLDYGPQHVPAFLPLEWAERYLGAFTAAASMPVLRRTTSAFLVRRALGDDRRRRRFSRTRHRRKGSGRPQHQMGPPTGHPGGIRTSPGRDRRRPRLLTTDRLPPPPHPSRRLGTATRRMAPDRRPAETPAQPPLRLRQPRTPRCHGLYLDPSHPRRDPIRHTTGRSPKRSRARRGMEPRPVHHRTLDPAEQGALLPADEAASRHLRRPTDPSRRRSPLHSPTRALTRQLKRSVTSGIAACSGRGRYRSNSRCSMSVNRTSSREPARRPPSWK